ncbi:Hypothetical predicted protein [Paramuricea clavata]|uniref:Uncharacterized protein n=1 Tax=Paramuricea clavata TaxID=317549 RepID=A0A7D9EFQ5_PARCT|nr:Hypothetical predicted protein [Paramuricea clavata]
MVLWKKAQNNLCHFCLNVQTLQHIVSSWKTSLDEGRYTWRHNSVLKHLATYISSVRRDFHVYADISGFDNPSVITGCNDRPDLNNPRFAELFAQKDDSISKVLFPTDKFKVLSGVKLPRSNLSWKAANEFFQSQFSVRPELVDLDSYCEKEYSQALNENFWKFCKNEFENTEELEPNLSEQSCFDYFKNLFKEKSKSRLFNWPSWLSSFPSASKDFDLECPTYREISKIIRKMKSRGSACPFDQIIIISFQRCPILRTHLWRIICKCWNEENIPSVWKHAAAKLIHKKDSTEDPANFRPICLEPVLLKVITSLLRNRIFKFVCENEFIESGIQKGFWPGISGTIEHTELLLHIINHARNKQRSLDLKKGHWFQFADDTAILRAHEEDNHLLRVEKCHTFGIKKQSSKAIQYQPVIIISGKRVPPIECEEGLTILESNLTLIWNANRSK